MSVSCVTLPCIIHSQWQSSKNRTVYIEIVRDNVFLVNIFCDKRHKLFETVLEFSFQSEVTARPYLELKHLMQDSSADITQAQRFPSIHSEKSAK